jgi:hypothetical protein
LFYGNKKKDANLFYLYQGNPTGKKGRPKVKDGKTLEKVLFDE